MPESRAVAYLGQVVHHAEDEHGVLDVVDENEGRLRSLHFGSSARQSTMFVQRPDELALEYTRCMMVALPFLGDEPRRALMLGLGGGSMVKFLLRACPGCAVDVAELRPAVVDVARRYFALPEDGARLRVHVGDGSAFVQQPPPAPWDLLLLDLHTSDGMAPVVVDPAFLPAVRRHTARGGVLAANLWFGVDRVVERRVRRILEDQYARVLYLPVAGKRNCIALGLPEAVPAWPDLQARAAAWAERTALPLPDLLQELARRHALR